MAYEQAVKRGLPYAEEVALYVAHGLLHAAGYDDLNPKAKRVMRRAEKRVMAGLRKAGLIPPMVMLVSACMMGICALALKKLRWRWMNDYALPISLLVGMISAIPITAWLG